MRSRTRLALAAGMAITGLAFAPLTNAQLFDGQRDHLQKLDAANSVLAAERAAVGDITFPGGLGGGIIDEPCTDGLAADTFACDGVDLLSFVPLASFVDTPDVEASDIWGWADPETGDEYALLGTTAGMVVFRITDPLSPEYLGRLDNPSDGRRIWHDIKVSGDTAFVVSESYFHGLVSFDLTQLRGMEADRSRILAPTGVYEGDLDSHNLVINEEAEVAYIVGSARSFSVAGRVTPPLSDGCLSGLHAVDVSDPENMTYLGCSPYDRYVHDAHCFRYDGPDSDHTGKDICVTAAEETVSVVDMTDPMLPQLLSTTTYVDHAYVHQGWMTEDHRYFLLGDELDEGGGVPTRTMIFDFEDLDAFGVTPDVYEHDTTVIDHNLYTLDGLVYQSNYEAGLGVFDLDDVGEGQLEKVATFDTYPESDNAEFNGTWSNYPYLPSGTIPVSGIGEGLFLLQVQDDVLEAETTD